MSKNSSNLTLTADDAEITKSTFVSHSVRKPEYKEYAFHANRNERQKRSLQTKVAAFWEIIDKHNYAAPQSTLFKPKMIQECVDPSDADDDTSDDFADDSMSQSEDERKRKSLMNQKWTHTLCLFKKRGLDKLALAARPKLCNRCDTKFSLDYSDQDCSSFLADYGEQDRASFSDSVYSSNGI